MQALRLSEIAKWLKTTLIGEDKTILGVSTDTRTLNKGDLFVAISGEQHDGHHFLKEAEAKGAYGALVTMAVNTHLPLIPVLDTEKALGEIARCYRHQFQIPIAAVTGSCGKTTVKEMLASILSVHGPALYNRGNLNTEIGLPLTLMRLESTHKTAVIEMGARKKGDIQYLMNITAPTVTVITNAGVAHKEIFGSEQGIAEAKGEIYACLSQKGTAVINLDESNAVYWKGLLQGQKTITFGLNSFDERQAKNGFRQDQHLTAMIQEEAPLFSKFIIKTPVEDIAIQLSAPGRHNISNALAAAAVSFAMGISTQSIKQGLEAFLPVSGRLQIKMANAGLRILDDTYNANPASVKAAIAVLKNFEAPTFFVMGDMLELGADAEMLHEEIGKYARSLGISKMYALGKLTPFVIQGFGENGKHFVDKESLIRELQHDIQQIQSQNSQPEIHNNQAPKTITMLVKGSRSMRMEEIVRALLIDSKENSPC